MNKNKFISLILIVFTLTSCNKLTFQEFELYANNMIEYINENSNDYNSVSYSYEEAFCEQATLIYSLKVYVDFDNNKAIYDIFSKDRLNPDTKYFKTTYIYEVDNTTHFLIDDNGTRSHEKYDNSKFTDHLSNFLDISLININYIDMALKNYPISEKYKTSIKGSNGKLSANYSYKSNRGKDIITDTNDEILILNDSYTYEDYKLKFYSTIYNINEINYERMISLKYYADVYIPLASDFLNQSEDEANQ